jgi:hypothetical protein
VVERVQEGSGTPSWKEESVLKELTKKKINQQLFLLNYR